MGLLAADQTPHTTLTLLDADHAGGTVRRTVLPGGLRVVTEHRPGTPVAAVGLATATGPRDDAPDAAGTSFLGRLLPWQGTRTRSGDEIAHALEDIGTSATHTCSSDHTWHEMEVPTEHVGRALEILAEVITAPSITPGGVALARQRVCQDIARGLDEPIARLREAVMAGQYPDHPLGRSILGTAETARSLSIEHLRSHHQQTYRPDRLVVGVVGNLGHQQIVEQLQTAFADALARNGDLAPARPRPAVPRPRAGHGTLVVPHPSGPAHLAALVEALAHTDPDLPALEVAYEAMLSRVGNLHRELGLAKPTLPVHQAWDESGQSGFLTSCGPGQVGELAERVRQVFTGMDSQPITRPEMERARRRAHNKLNTHYERAKGRLKQLLTQEHHRPRHRSLSQLHQDLNEVDLDQVREVATRVYTRPPLLALTGPFEPDHTF